MKYVLVIGDGMADEPITELGGITPLQYAQTPAMDSLASAGEIGNVLTIPEGLPAGSDVAILSIFGCDPQSCYTGRAPLEAAATDIALKPGDVAYRCNMVAFDDGEKPFEDRILLSHSAGSIGGEESAALIMELFDIPGFKYAAEKARLIIHPALSFRHIAVQEAPDNTGLALTPPHDHLGEAIGRHLPRGAVNAAVLEGLMRLAYDTLNSHQINTKRRSEGKLPANGIWFWAEGTAVELPEFSSKYRKTGVIISAVPLCRGIGALIGLDRIYVEGATGELNTNYEGKAAAVLEALKDHDFAAVHIEAPDECSHDVDIKGKLKAIEWIDSRIIAPLQDKLRLTGMDYRMLVLSDHKTLLSTRGHAGGAVPYVIFDSRFDRKTGQSFCESDAGRGKIMTSGTELMGLLFEETK